MTSLDGSALEAIIVDLEQRYQVSITIIDREGFFHDFAGNPIFTRPRHSHRKNIACDRQFDQRCIDHCRHAMNKMGEKKKTAFEHSCWKGISEIAVPLYLNGIHHGTCYVGQWQSRRKELQPQYNKEFKSAYLRSYDALPKKNSKSVKELLPIAQFIAQSILYHAQALKKNPQAQPDRRQIIEHFIQEQAAQNLNLDALANHLGLSPSRCSHAVKECCGKSLSDLIIKERIRRACQLLSSSTYNAQEIAEIVGFSDQYYFNKAFKAQTGLPPGRFRKQMNQ